MDHWFLCPWFSHALEVHRIERWRTGDVFLNGRNPISSLHSIYSIVFAEKIIITPSWHTVRMFAVLKTESEENLFWYFNCEHTILALFILPNVIGTHQNSPWQFLKLFWMLYIQHYWKLQKHYNNKPNLLLFFQHYLLDLQIICTKFTLLSLNSTHYSWEFHKYQFPSLNFNHIYVMRKWMFFPKMWSHTFTEHIYSQNVN